MASVVLDPSTAVKGDCQGSCNATAECGEYAPKGEFDCPLNVCCSEHGYCGYTSEFCNSKCQNPGGCPEVDRPGGCDANKDAMDAEVRIAYYGAWSAGRSCNALQPENIPAGVLTHIYVAFEYVSENHEITEEYGSIAGRVSRLKNIYPGLKTVIALGGWVFNDPPTHRRFSNMVSTVPNREKFINSLIRYMKKYSLDGVDLDWEYPVAPDRGGVDEDYDNFVLLCAEIRKAFEAEDPGWELTMTLPNSYWYLRGFDIKRLEKHVDWFNVMTYDIHGIWDQENIWTGPYLKGHTNLTEIEEGLDLLWRNGINEKKVVMGYGFYGRGFTMTDPNCSTPPSCTFNNPSFPGDCTNEPGILSYSEVIGMSHELGSKISYDEKSSVKWMVYGANQWISWDDEESFKAKKKFMFSRCLKGLMIWELGLDSADYQAMIGLFGEEAVSKGLSDTSLNPKEKEKLTLDLSAYNGQFCYVTEECVSSNDDNDNEKGRCMSGYSVAETAHAPGQIRSDRNPPKNCKEGSFHRICCPTKAMPKNCEWNGAPERNVLGCSGNCGDSQFELATDTFAVIQQTSYDSVTGLMNPIAAQRTVSSIPGFDPLEDCKWSNDPSRFADGEIWSRTALACVSKECDSKSLAITGSFEPSTIDDLKEDMGSDVCELWAPPTPPAAAGIQYALCCSPPSRFTDDWPVSPAYLWNGAHIDKDDDVSWQWSNNFGNNNKDTSPTNLESDPGDDPYGFVMLDGPPGSIAKQFDRQFTVLTVDEPVNVKRRSFITTNQTILDSTFEHVEQVVHVYCNFPHDSKHCTEVFNGGVRDTIIKLPAHVGEGPWARVVSMEPDNDPPELPKWTQRKRSESGVHRNGIYKLTFDYDFHLIKRADEEPVFMRVDYTNLQEYWDEVTDEDPKNNNKRKRSATSGMGFEAWKSRVDKAKRGAYADLDGFDFERTETTTDFSPTGYVPPSPYNSKLSSRDVDIERRWFGTFVNWLKKVTRITSEESGHLPMGLSKVFNIWSGRIRCENSAGVVITAGLDVTADVRLQMQAKYAYYFSGTVVPPSITDTYVYIGAQPNIYAGVTIRGDAELRYQSDVKKLIQTISYPGLSIKGIATVGPSLDLYGRIEGRITVSGQLRVGAKYTFSPIEMYLPNDEETHDKASDQLSNYDTNEQGISPVFQANVRAEVDAHLRVTPELNCGIKVGGQIGPLKEPFIDGHVSTFMNTSLHFNAEVTADTNGQQSNWQYGYKVELLWRIGMKAIAQVYTYKRWNSKTYYPVDWQTIPVYGPIVVKSTGSGNRLAAGSSQPWDLSNEPLPNTVFGWEGAPVFGAVESPFDKDWSKFDADDWVNASRSLGRRQSGKEVEFPENSFTDFKCTTGNNSPCSQVSPNTRRDVVPYTPRGRNIVKRAINDCRDKIPILFYNCGFFADVPIQSATGARTLPGICRSIRRFLTNHNIITDQYPLTYDSSVASEARWRLTCSDERSPCQGATGEDALIKQQLGTPWNAAGKKITNCDEFPFKSAEQGGDWNGINPGNPLGTTRTCVPTWQNSMQGVCNALLPKIETNVEYFNDAKNPTGSDPAKEAFQSWTDLAWYTKKGFKAKGDPGRQRLTEYNDNHPNTFGQNADDQANLKLSWFHKRNYTLQLVTPDAGGAVTFPVTGYTSGVLNNKGTSLNSAAWIVCAISLRGQERFRFRANAQGVRQNGYCWDGSSWTLAWKWEENVERIKYFSCTIEFAGAPSSPTKRDVKPIGYFGGEPIYSVKRAEEDYHEIIVDVPLKDVPLPDYREAFPLST
ncbi:hypothetical protein NUW58_g6925 [Xylaria curta]|uniref:Uncharacterized protein n=1 Tax=Xylaria curta TaxID=42375 RepID=A0ACC1NML6_9PEZI|nr:hypothetical protein NUW58_g6925 [Xylaria curta]